MATKVRFTALSISSMHMNIWMALRLMMTPTTPMVKSTAESARYQVSGIIAASTLPTRWPRRRRRLAPLQLQLGHRAPRLLGHPRPDNFAAAPCVRDELESLVAVE